jgi:polyhydroxyalkanoate synthesis regulator phasin
VAEGAQKRKADPGVVTRLAAKGEETVERLADEAAKHKVVNDALHRAADAKGKIEQVSRKVLHELGIAPAAEVDRLRREVARLERRLKKLEGERKASP